MVWTHNERYMLSVDDGGRVKYWRTNYELLKDEAAHQDAVCGVTVAPSDAKFATCSKDGTLKVLTVFSKQAAALYARQHAVMGCARPMCSRV